MSLSLEQVRHVAQLARLALSPEEEAQSQQQLSAVLEAIASLRNLDTRSVSPTSSVHPEPVEGGGVRQAHPERVSSVHPEDATPVHPEPVEGGGVRQAHPERRAREDVAHSSPGLLDKALQNAPSVVGTHFSVPRIIE